MAQKYVSLVGGLKKLIEAVVTSVGAGDAGKIPALDAAGKLDNSLMPTGIGAETESIPASEDLSAGDFVNIWDDAGTLKIRKADASGGFGKKADRFVLAAVTTGNNGTVYPLTDINNQLAGLTIGANYWLSGTAAGAVTTTPPTSTGYIIQYLGKASATTQILTECHEAIEIA